MNGYAEGSRTAVWLSIHQEAAWFSLPTFWIKFDMIPLSFVWNLEADYRSRGATSALMRSICAGSGHVGPTITVLAPASM